MRDGLGGVDTILLVGGTSDIGQAIVTRLAPRTKVILLGRPSPQLTRRAEEMEQGLGVEVTTIDWDAMASGDQAQAVEAAFAAAEIDIAVISPGVLGDVEDHVQTPRAAVAMAKVTYLGAMSALLECARLMRAQGHGEIVVLSSFAVVRPRPANFVYGSAKAGLDYVARGLADRLRGTAVRVIVIRPGFVRTSMTEHLKDAPMSIHPEAVADVVQRARSSRRTVHYAPASLAPLATVFRVLPGAVIRRLREG